MTPKATGVTNQSKELVSAVVMCLNDLDNFKVGVNRWLALINTDQKAGLLLGEHCQTFRRSREEVLTQCPFSCCYQCLRPLTATWLRDSSHKTGQTCNVHVWCCFVVLWPSWITWSFFSSSSSSFLWFLPLKLLLGSGDFQIKKR